MPEFRTTQQDSTGFVIRPVLSSASFSVSMTPIAPRVRTAFEKLPVYPIRVAILPWYDGMGNHLSATVTPFEPLV